uniref:HNH endonuclease n=1 Tax=Demequina sp. TaxID=2050685 RepID=UPI0025E04EC3
TVAHEAAALVRNLAEVPLAVASRTLSERSSLNARRSGHQSNTHLAANAAGAGLGRTRETIEAGSLLEEDAASGDGAGAGLGDGTGSEGEAGGPGGGAGPRYRHVAAAFGAGRLSSEQGALLKRTLDALGDAAFEVEQDLLAKALRMSLGDLRRVCRTLRARRDPDAVAEREKQQYADRFVAVSEDSDGMVRVTARLDPASAAPVTAWLDAQTKDAYQRRREQDPAMADVRSRGQIQADAFVMLFNHGLDCEAPTSGVKTVVVVRLDAQAMRDGLGFGECEQTAAPISAGRLRRMAVDAGILPLTLGGESEVLDVGREKRLFTKPQRHALVERDGGCAFCHAPPAWCAAHHLRWWSHGGRTDLSNGILLCTTCHHRIHDDGWEIRIRDGKVWFTPPAAVDQARTPRLGGRAALEVATAGRDDASAGRDLAIAGRDLATTSRATTLVP